MTLLLAIIFNYEERAKGGGNVLQQSLKSLFGQLRASSSNPHIYEDRILLAQDLNLRESFEQSIEAQDNVPLLLDELSGPQRWFTVDPEHGGLAHERVLYRT